MREIEDIHIPFLAWLRELRIPVVYHRPDRKSGIQTGWPDFTVLWMGRAVCIEAKKPGEHPSDVQSKVHAFIRASGNRVSVCRSVEECKEAVKNVLCVTSVNLLAPKLNPDLNGDRFYVGRWGGKSYVFAPDQSGAYRMIREASVIDRFHLPELP